MRTFDKAVFSIDGSGAYVGVHDNTYWNGWAKPWFTKEEAIRFLESQQDSGYWTYSYDEGNDTFIMTEVENNDPSYWKGEEIDGVIRYDIGASYLVWVTEEEKTFFHKDKSGRDGHYSISLIDMVSDSEHVEEFDETEEDDRENTLIGWAMYAEIGDTYSDNASEWTRTA